MTSSNHMPYLLTQSKPVIDICIKLAQMIWYPGTKLIYVVVYGQKI